MMEFFIKALSGHLGDPPSTTLTKEGIPVPILEAIGLTELCEIRVL